VRLEPPRGPTTTVAQGRRDLVETIGTWAFNRRMNAELASGRVRFLGGNASVQEWPRVLRISSAEASGRPGTWRGMLADLGTTLQRARLHGFTERELQDARAAFMADAEAAARRESTRPARELLYQINRGVTRQEPLMSAAQTLAVLQRLLPGITAREV